MSPKKRLGRGLNSLLSAATEALPGADEILSLHIDSIVPNRLQPRHEFDEAKMDELVGSITDNGLIQPIVVRRSGDAYEVVAGERRLRAARRAGLETVPALVRNVPDEKMLELAIAENIHREDLNPIDRANAYRKLIDTFNLTQEQAASRLGIDRSSLANTIRLLELAPQVQELVSRGTISFGHARALLGVDDPDHQLALAARVVKQGLSVRQTEAAVDSAKARSTLKSSRKPSTRARSPQLRLLEQTLREALGTRVRVEYAAASGKGKILVDFFSNEEFERIFTQISGSPPPA